MVGAVVGNVAAAASRPRMDSPVRTLSTAENSGMMAATNDANMISSSTSAQARPMISDVVSLVFMSIWPALPPYSTVRPALRAGATALSSWSR